MQRKSLFILILGAILAYLIYKIITSVSAIDLFVIIFILATLYGVLRLVVHIKSETNG